MGELVKIEFNENHFHESKVKAREVYKVLGVKKDFTDWFKYHVKNMGLVEGKDFLPILGKSTGGRPATDYEISVDVAKHLCMASQTPMSHTVRKYFIEAEKRYYAEKALWDDPDFVIARALQMAEKKISDITLQNL